MSPPLSLPKARFEHEVELKPIAYGTVALIAAAAGFVIYRYALEPRAADASLVQARTQVQAEAQARGAPGIPAELPEFSLQDRDGQPRSIRSWPDKSMIVNFWATWCAPCRREIPLLKTLQQRHGAEGFQVVGVAVDFREDVLKYAQDMAIDYPILIGEQDGLEAVNKFGMGTLGFPFTVFTDTQGRIVATHLGELHPRQADLILDAVRRVNSGELTPLAARAVVTRQLAGLAPEATS